METPRIEVILTSPPDREHLVTELWINNIIFCEVSQDQGKPMIEIYPRPDKETWCIEANLLLASLSKAVGRLAACVGGESGVACGE